MQSWIHKSNRKGFTLVEVIVVAVIVAVLALVGIQLYQGYVTESQRNTAENLAASAAGFIQTIANSRTIQFADDITPDSLPPQTTWAPELSDGGEQVTFTTPANASVVKDDATGLVRAYVNGVASTGTYPYKTVAANPTPNP